MEYSTALMLALWAATLIALVIILFRLRGGRSTDNTDRLAATVETLKAELLARQTESLLALRTSIDNANRLINERLAEGTLSLDRRMAVLGEIENQLGQLTRQTDNIETVGKNIQSLSDLLRPPKLRGSVGEMLLENLLGQILPASSFEAQYRFADGVRVDAIVRLGDRLLPIDAKFPLEAYERLRSEPEDKSLQKQFGQAFRKHIDDIADKYIQAGRQTTDFAVMYIPAEAVYYQLVAQDDQGGFDYALSRRVIPSSPGHLYAFLASVASLHREMAILGGEAGEESRKLRVGLERLAETSGRLERFHNRMESSLRALTTGLEHARSELGQIQLEVARLKDPLAVESEKEDE